MAQPTSSAQERFEALFRRHYRAVLRYAARRADTATAEDVANETFGVLWRRLGVVPVGGELPWLLVTARHELANRARAGVREHDKHRRGASGSPVTGRDPAEALAERDAVVRAFLELSERDREVLRLVAWDDLSAADAAKVLGVSRAAFAMRLTRARRRLSRALGAQADLVVPSTTSAVEVPR